MLKNQKGFNLIELMSVSAIMGVMSMFVVDGQRDYIARSQMARVVQEVSSIKAGLDSAIISGFDPSNATSITAAGATDVADLTGYLGSNLLDGATASDQLLVTYSAGAYTVRAQLANNVREPGARASDFVDGAIVSLRRCSNGAWECRVDSSQAGPGWKSTLVSDNCPNTPHLPC